MKKKISIFMLIAILICTSITHTFAASNHTAIVRSFVFTNTKIVNTYNSSVAYTRGRILLQISVYNIDTNKTITINNYKQFCISKDKHYVLISDIESQIYCVNMSSLTINKVNISSKAPVVYALSNYFLIIDKNILYIYNPYTNIVEKQIPCTQYIINYYSKIIIYRDYNGHLSFYKLGSFPITTKYICDKIISSNNHIVKYSYKNNIQTINLKYNLFKN